ncbi:n-alpha-acetyltransferase auxiliary subunit [Stylonychia lemnae]|uniref:N-alpha-acetyltransferase auxiliary subunit n=1 Tax=Stylonychia lemnae TaxID=5949 RepID=A0A078B683_STYLE|nr:n-alpha-acetyltransferase auxiliary subunit [Stylonychia lemnae]|eukprot:CDW89048.1 n-alpha-acetyltransferase auxiliary subunit [Stylonychia lemnae]
MESTSENKQDVLSRKDVYQIIGELEALSPDTQDSELEDVTSLIYSTVEKLNDCEFLAKNDFDLNESMSAFEVMDLKMDMRLRRKEYLHPKMAIQTGLLKIENSLSLEEQIAVLNEFMIQFSCWQKYNVSVQQTIYSCYYLIKREYYEKNPYIASYIEALHLLILTFYENARYSNCLRDEDICFPPCIQKNHQKSLKDILAQINDQISELSKDKNNVQFEVIAGHLKFIRSMMLILLNAFDKDLITAKENNEETKQSSKKKKKNPLLDVPAQIKVLEQSLTSLKKFEQLDQSHNEWAEKLFDQKIVPTLPLVSNLKKFQRHDFNSALVFFTEFHSDLVALENIREKTQYFEELIYDMNQFSSKNPCSMIRLIYERTIFPDPSQMLVLKNVLIQDFLMKGIIEVHPFIKNHLENDTFKEFYHKYSLVAKELMMKCLRNPSRQRRSISKYFDDFNILLNEANIFDNEILTKLGQNPRLGNTVALNMVINISMLIGLEYLNRGMELELFSNHEMYMAFNYSRLVYQMLIFNRKPQISGMNEDLLKLNLVDLNDLNASPDKFKQRRKKSTFVQKLVYDEFEFFKAMFSINGGMTLLAAYAMKQGLVKNIIAQEGVEKQVYEQRFGVFATMQFPRYISYEEYKANLENDCNMDSKELLEKAKNLFIEGKNILQKLIQTEDTLKNDRYFNKQYLEKIQRIAIMNSLNLTKISMFGENAVFKVNRTDSLPHLILIEVEKKK